MLHYAIYSVVRKNKPRSSCITEVFRNLIFCVKTKAIAPQRVQERFNIIKGQESVETARDDALMSGIAVTRELTATRQRLIEGAPRYAPCAGGG